MKRLKTFGWSLAAVAALGTFGLVGAQAPQKSAVLQYSSDGKNIYYDGPGYGGLGGVDEESVLNREVAKLMEDNKQKASESEKSEINKKLVLVVSRLFEIKQLSRQGELKKLDEQLAKLKELHEKREREKASIVNDRVTQLIREAEGLGWGSTEVNRVWTGLGSANSTSGTSGYGSGGSSFGSTGPAQASGGFGNMGGDYDGSMGVYGASIGGGMSSPSSAAASSRATTGTRAPNATSSSLNERLLEWGRKSVAKNDKDNNESLDPSEFSGDFAKADTNKDGKIDVEEYVKHSTTPVRK